MDELQRQRIRPVDPWKDLDPDDAGGDPEGRSPERRTGCLELLYVYTRMIKILERRVDWTLNEALATGASYGDIADACGLTRQAVRQRWLRRRQRGDTRTVRPVRGLSAVGWDGTWPYVSPAKNIYVRLVGGPRNGDRASVRLGQTIKSEIFQPSDSGGFTSQLARYVPTPDDKSVYIFDGLEPTDYPPPDNQKAVKPRIYEIAKEFGVESKAVIARLRAMGEYARSAAETVDPDALRKLWEHFTQPESHNKSG